MSPAVCTIEAHEAMKASNESWDAGTEEIPHLNGRSVFVFNGRFSRWGNCRTCKSTLIRRLSVRLGIRPKAA